MFFNIHFYFPELQFALGPYLPNLCFTQCIRLLKMNLAFQNYCGPPCALNSIIVKSLSEKLLNNKREMVDQHYQRDLSHLYYTEG